MVPKKLQTVLYFNVTVSGWLLKCKETVSAENTCRDWADSQVLSSSPLSGSKSTHGLILNIELFCIHLCLHQIKRVFTVPNASDRL